MTRKARITLKIRLGMGGTLIGMNGATTSDALAVNLVNTSITMTWGQVKSESF